MLVLGAGHKISRDPYVLTASVLANLLAFTLPLLMLQIYDRIIPRQGYESLSVLAIGLFFAIGMELIMRVSRTQIMSLAGDAFSRRLHDQVFAKILKSNISDIEKETPGAHIDRISSISRIREFRFGETAMAALDLPFAVIFLIIIALISPFLALFVLSIVTVSYLVMRHLQARAISLSEDKHKIDRRRHSFLIEVLSGIESVKSFNLEAFMERRYERLVGTTAQIGAKATMRSNYAQAVTGAIGQYTPALVAGAGSIFVINQSLTVGALAAVTVLSSRIVQPILRLSALRSNDEDVNRIERELEQFLKLPDHVGTGAKQKCQHLEQIALKDIYVSRQGQDKPVFDNLDLTLNRGETIVIDGENGSGRSSLLWMIMGYRAAEQGRVLVNGLDIAEYDPRQLRQRIAYLPQQPQMLSGTVLDNMTNFQPELYLDDAIEIAEALGLSDYFAAHQEGLSTRVGNGVDAGLPTSVAQRVPLVGALVGQPDLILFDEANANLDFEGDQRLLEYLKSQQPHAAIIMITQRPSYARIADRLYDLRDGRLQLQAYPPVDQHSSGAVA